MMTMMMRVDASHKRARRSPWGIGQTPRRTNHRCPTRSIQANLWIVLLLFTFALLSTWWSGEAQDWVLMEDLLRIWEVSYRPQAQPSSPALVEHLAREHDCAINFFGLPRAFSSLALPSIIQHVIAPNTKYECDYFVHYYNLTYEQAGRSGNGGKVHPHDTRLLTEAVQNATPVRQHFANTPTVEYRMTTEADFWTQYRDFLHLTRTAVDDHNRSLYHPWKEHSYHLTQIANIVKMWHSMQQVHDLMMMQSKNYTRVAMLRSDVFYQTPIDVWETDRRGMLDVANQVAVVPAFAKYPVNDRMIYGPSAAVKVWATSRFSRIAQHVAWVAQHKPGYGMHSETFVARLLDHVTQEYPRIRVVEHGEICFLRVRSDESIWVNDCAQEPPYAGDQFQALPVDQMRAAIEHVLGRPCFGGEPAPVAPDSGTLALHCPVDPTIYNDDERR